MAEALPSEDELPEALPTQGRVLTKAATVYDWVQPIVTLGQEARLNRWIAQRLNLEGQRHVLDVGCGTGLLTLAIAERYPSSRVVGVDASKAMIGVANRKRTRTNCSYRQALAEDLPFGEETFDVVTSALFFHHVNQDLKLRCLREAWRVLKPRGMLVVADMDRPYTLLGWAMSATAWKLFRQPEIKENMDGMMERLIPKAGFGQAERHARFSGYISVLSAGKARV